MNYSIRNYSKHDFPLISSWWKEANEVGPTESMLPEESTFVLELDSIPILCLSVYLTNCKEVCYFENFIGSPNTKSPIRKKLANILIETASEFVKNLGYKKVLCFAHTEKLKLRYKEFGFYKTCTNLDSFVKEVN